MATVADIIDAARAVCLLSTSDISDAKMIKWVNEANDKVCSAFDWPFLKDSDDTIQTGSGTGIADMPADFARLRTVLLKDKTTKLAEISDNEAWERWGDDYPDGTPSVFWFTDEDTIQIAPIESGQTDLTVHYWKTPTALTAVGNTPVFDDRFHLVLADWVLYRVYEREEDYQKAQRHEVAFNRGINDMARHYFNQAQDYPIVMGERSDYAQRRRGNANMPWLDGA